MADDVPKEDMDRERTPEETSVLDRRRAAEVRAGEEGHDRHADPDVLLDVPTLKVDEINLEVSDLRARVSLNAEVLDLLRLHVGADVGLGKVTLDIKGVEAQALLKVRLDNVALIIQDVLKTIDNNPQLLENITSSVGRAVESVGTGTGQAVGELGTSAGQAVQHLGASTGHAVENVGTSAGHAVENVGTSTGHAVENLGNSTGQAVQGVAPAVGRTAGGLGTGVASTTNNNTRSVVRNRGVSAPSPPVVGSRERRSPESPAAERGEQSADDSQGRVQEPPPTAEAKPQPEMQPESQREEGREPRKEKGPEPQPELELESKAAKETEPPQGREPNKEKGPEPQSELESKTPREPEPPAEKGREPRKDKGPEQQPGSEVEQEKPRPEPEKEQTAGGEKPVPALGPALRDLGRAATRAGLRKLRDLAR